MLCYTAIWFACRLFTKYNSFLSKVKNVIISATINWAGIISLQLNARE